MDRINAQGFSQGPAAEIGPRIESALARGETVTLQISGDSMRPTLKPRRDAAVLEPLQTWPPRRGEILFFRRANGEYVLHRVLRLTPEGPIMNGDAQGWTEGPVPRAQVLARASGLLRNGRLLDTRQGAYRAYVALWRLTRPVRKSMFACWRAVKRLLGRR